MPFREKDGVWACLAWLSVIAHLQKPIDQIVREHWQKYGRNVFTRLALLQRLSTFNKNCCRYDYENCDAQSCNLMMNWLEQSAPGMVGVEQAGGLKIQLADNFAYTDPVDGSQASKQV